MLFSRKFLVSKKFLEKKGVIPGFPVDKFVSRSAEKKHRGTHSCFIFLDIDKVYDSEI